MGCLGDALEVSWNCHWGGFSVSLEALQVSFHLGGGLGCHRGALGVSGACMEWKQA